MSKDQKGFIVYGDIKAVIDELDDGQVAQLFRGMVEYFINGREPKFSGILKFVFIPIKQQMDRDADKYVQKCEKMRENANKRWNDMQKDAIASKSMQMMQKHANDANTNTKTNTDTKTDTDTTTTTNINTNGGGGGYGDEFNIWKQLTPDDIDAIYDAYPDSGGFLIEEVASDVKAKRKSVRNARTYILGYAKRVGWDDKADHGKMPWEVS